MFSAIDFVSANDMLAITATTSRVPFNQLRGIVVGALHESAGCAKISNLRVVSH